MNHGHTGVGRFFHKTDFGLGDDAQCAFAASQELGQIKVGDEGRIAEWRAETGVEAESGPLVWGQEGSGQAIQIIARGAPPMFGPAFQYLFHNTMNDGGYFAIYLAFQGLCTAPTF